MLMMMMMMSVLKERDSRLLLSAQSQLGCYCRSTVRLVGGRAALGQRSRTPSSPVLFLGILWEYPTQLARSLSLSLLDASTRYRLRCAALTLF